MVHEVEIVNITKPLLPLVHPSGSMSGKTPCSNFANYVQHFSCPSLLVYIGSSAWAPDEKNAEHEHFLHHIKASPFGPTLLTMSCSLSSAFFSIFFDFGVEEVPVHPSTFGLTFSWHLHSISTVPSASHTAVSSCGCRPLRAMCLTFFFCRQKSTFLSASAQLFFWCSRMKDVSAWWFKNNCLRARTRGSRPLEKKHKGTRNNENRHTSCVRHEARTEAFGTRNYTEYFLSSEATTLTNRE